MKKLHKSKVICLICVISMISMIFLPSCERYIPVVMEFTPAGTIVIYTITDPSTTPEAIRLVEEELSRLTRGRFATQIRLKAIPADQYEATVFEILNRFTEEETKAAEARSISESVSRSIVASERAAGIVRTTEAPARRTTVETTTADSFYFPEPYENQMDILFIGSSEMFQTLINNGQLAPLREHIGSTEKLLNEFIFPPLMQTAARQGNEIFAIPVNRPIGEMEFLAVNKRLALEYGLFEGTAAANTVNNRLAVDYVRLGLIEPLEVIEAEDEESEDVLNIPNLIFRNDSGSFLRLEDYIELEGLIREPAGIAANLESFIINIARNMPDIIPIDAPFTIDRHLSPLFEEYPYFPMSIITPVGTIFRPGQITVGDDGVRQSTAPTINFSSNITPFPAATYNHRIFREIANLNNRLRQSGAFDRSAGASDREYGVFIKSGTFGDMRTWDTNYLYIPFRRPEITLENTQDAMFGISASSRDVPRALEILTFMNTNAEFKNVLQFGIEDIHYTIRETFFEENNQFMQIRQVERLNNDYVMKSIHTGNTYLAMTEIDLSVYNQLPDSERIYHRILASRQLEYAKQHNLLLRFSPRFALDIDLRQIAPAVLLDHVSEINDLSEAFWYQAINGFIPEDRFESHISDVVLPAIEVELVIESDVGEDEDDTPPEIISVYASLRSQFIAMLTPTD